MQEKIFPWLGYLIFWLLLSVLAGLTAWQGYITFVYLAVRLIETPALRPTGWNTHTLVGVSKFLMLVWGSLCLLFVFYLEHPLRESVQEKRLLRQSLRYLLLLGVFYAVLYLLTVI